ncbi:MAG TPA: hypothetical protein PKV48_02200 [Thermodesulfobacteriota bacterium]|nr:hypothetical protein [Thermodesulfobacteriota bacterium]
MNEVFGMLRRYVIIINVLLIAGCLFLANRIVKTWKTDEPLRSGFVKKEKVMNLTALKVNYPLYKSKNDYQTIVDKDLFRPERTEWKSPTQEGENAPARVPPQVMVYGIVITQASKYAWIQEQGKTEKMIKISEGGEINGWKVITIEPDALSVKSGDQVITFNLIQPGKPKTRAVVSPIMQSQPKSSTNSAAYTQSGLSPALTSPLPLVPPPPPLPQKNK